MSHPGGSAIGKTAFAVGGMGLTALVALAVGGPLAAATVAVAGRVLGEALGESGKKLTETFVEKASDYFWDSAGEPLIDGFRVEHPTLEDIYRRAVQLSLLSLRPPASKEKQRKKSDAAEYDWFEYWDIALKSGIPFSAAGIKLPKNGAEADESFTAAMEILAAQGAKRHRSDISLTLETESLPEELFHELKAALPGKLDHFFNSLLVKDENTSAYKEHDLVFKQQFLASFARLEQKVDDVKTDITAVREEQAVQGRRQVEDSEKLDAILKMLGGRFDAGIEAGTVPESALAERDALIARQAEELETLRKQFAARASEPARSEPNDAELSKALADGDLDAALRLKTDQVKHSTSAAARDLYELGTIHELRFEWPQALAAFRKAWELGKDPVHGFYYAWFAQKLNRFNEAIAAYQYLLDIYNEPSDRATTLNNLAILYRDTQRMKEAEQAYGEALAIRRKLAETNPDAYLPDVAMTLNNLAILYRDTQRMKEAEQAYGEALATYRKLAETNPDAYLPDVAMTLNDLAYFCHSSGHAEEAQRQAFEAEGILDPLWRANPDLHGNPMARILWTRALISEASGKPSEACALARRGLAAAYDLNTRQSIQQIIDRLCPASPA